MNELISLLENEKLGNTFEGTAGNDAGGVEKAGQKRKHDGEMEATFLGVPPANDVYRSRQQKRVHVT